MFGTTLVLRLWHYPFLFERRVIGKQHIVTSCFLGKFDNDFHNLSIAVNYLLVKPLAKEVLP